MVAFGSVEWDGTRVPQDIEVCSRLADVAFRTSGCRLWAPNRFSHDTSLTADRSKVKRVLVVSFKTGTSTAVRQAAIDTVQGTVVVHSGTLGDHVSAD